MSILSRPLTYADLQRARDASDERLELIEGEIVVTPSPSLMHQIVLHRLAVLFDRAIVEPGLGWVIEAPFDVFLDEQDVPQSDLMVVLRDRTEILGSEGLAGAPRLVVEILSLSTAGRDRVRKRNLYARFGVPEYWLVDPDARIVTIFNDPQNGRYQAETRSSNAAVSVTIPELSVDLKALVAPVPGL
jgi:Uma2 family endonuclease